MRLRIRRNQAQVKGLFGGHKGMSFHVVFQADLEPSEVDLIRRYRAEGEWLAGLPDVADGRVKVVQGDRTGVVLIGTLLAGLTFQCRDVATLLSIEAKLREACQAFQTYLQVMASFGGEEILEF